MGGGGLASNGSLFYVLIVVGLGQVEFMCLVSGVAHSPLLRKKAARKGFGKLNMVLTENISRLGKLTNF